MPAPDLKLPLAPEPLRKRPRGYFPVTRTATYGFLAALPLLLLYEGLILVVQASTGQAIRIGADVWMKSLFALVFVVVGIAVFMRERRHRIPIRAAYFGGIVGESLVYAVVLAGLVSTTVGLIFGMSVVRVPLMLQTVGELSLPLQLVLSIGAGLYEELFFRVLLVGGLYLLLRRLMPKRTQAYVVAALIGAVIFSWVHYVGPFGDPFTLASFTYRFLFGLALNAVFLVRGFALAAWTHALYDVLVVTGSFG
jgi:membrane protease YdiL (CAAX protease family)